VQILRRRSGSAGFGSRFRSGCRRNEKKPLFSGCTLGVVDDPVSFVVWTAVGSDPRIALTLSERGGWPAVPDGWTLARDPALPASEVRELELPAAVRLPEPAPPAELERLIEINAQHRDHEVEQDQHDDDDKGAIEGGNVLLLQGGEERSIRLVLQYINAHQAEVEADDRGQEQPRRPPFLTSPIALY